MLDISIAGHKGEEECAMGMLLACHIWHVFKLKCNSQCIHCQCIVLWLLSSLTRLSITRLKAFLSPTIEAPSCYHLPSTHLPYTSTCQFSAAMALLSLFLHSSLKGIMHTAVALNGPSPTKHHAQNVHPSHTMDQHFIPFRGYLMFCCEGVSFC